MTIKKRITASNFYSYCLCPRSLYLDIFGDPKNKIPLSDFLQNLLDKGKSFEKETVKKLGITPIETFFKDEEEAFSNTLEQMKNGENTIYQGTLLHEHYIGIPDLLEKVDGKSIFGNYYYRPVDIKMGRSLDEKYRLQVTFYAFLLEKIQGKLPAKGGIILFDNSKELFSIEEMLPKFTNVFNHISEIVKGKEEDLHIFSGCNDCQWKNVCKEAALKKNDVSLVYNLQKRIKTNLKAIGINTVEALAKMPAAELVNMKFVGKKTAERLQLQAQSLVENKIIKIGSPKFRQKPIEIFFDIEGETNLKVEYLFGVLIRKNGKEEYKTFVADYPKDEEKTWKDFLAYLTQLDDYVMYHYHSYETTVLKRFTEKYNTSKDELMKMITRMVDLRTLVTNNLIFPIYKYSIKDIAKYLGFRWSNKDANAAQSMLWYSLWLESGDRKYLDLSIEYNKDDCIATRVVKDWMQEYFRE